MTSYQAVKAAGNSARLYFVIDGSGHRVGRLASVIATVLQGKVRSVCCRSGEREKKSFCLFFF